MNSQFGCFPKGESQSPGGATPFKVSRDERVLAMLEASFAAEKIRLDLLKDLTDGSMPRYGQFGPPPEPPKPPDSPKPTTFDPVDESDADESDAVALMMEDEIEFDPEFGVKAVEPKTRTTLESEAVGQRVIITPPPGWKPGWKPLTEEDIRALMQPKTKVDPATTESVEAATALRENIREEQESHDISKPTGLGTVPGVTNDDASEAGRDPRPL